MSPLKKNFTNFSKITKQKPSILINLKKFNIFFIFYLTSDKKKQSLVNKKYIILRFLEEKSFVSKLHG
jgi:hypothetical protein